MNTWILIAEHCTVCMYNENWTLSIYGTVCHIYNWLPSLMNKRTVGWKSKTKILHQMKHRLKQTISQKINLSPTIRPSNKSCKDKKAKQYHIYSLFFQIRSQFSKKKSHIWKPINWKLDKMYFYCSEITNNSKSKSNCKGIWYTPK